MHRCTATGGCRLGYCQSVRIRIRSRHPTPFGWQSTDDDTSPPPAAARRPSQPQQQTGHQQSRIVPIQLSLDGCEQLRLDLHGTCHCRPLCQHSFPHQDYVGESIIIFIALRIVASHRQAALIVFFFSLLSIPENPSPTPPSSSSSSSSSSSLSFY